MIDGQPFEAYVDGLAAKALAHLNSDEEPDENAGEHVGTGKNQGS